jgi:hypothetical protein
MKINSFAVWALPSAALLLALHAPTAAETGSDQPSAKTPSVVTVEDVRVRPRGRHFIPNSAEDEAIQRRLTIFNEQQSLDNAALDKKLRICRGC